MKNATTFTIFLTYHKICYQTFVLHTISGLPHVIKLINCYKSLRISKQHQKWWHIQKLPDAGIPVWAPKLCAQIKEKHAK